MKYDSTVPLETRIVFNNLTHWIRQRFFFPVRIPVYVKSAKRIRAKDGELCVGTFFGPYDYSQSPYIRIAAGDYEDLIREKGEIQAQIALLLTLLHELTHYYQWVNSEKLTPIGEERQASQYADRLITEYLDDTGLIKQL